MSIELKRVYEDYSPADGYRVLVDRLWPRGVRKMDARIDEWCKACAPSTDLRKWFDHDPLRWALFRKMYLKELESKRHEATSLVARATPGPLTLVYGATNISQNHAIILRGFIRRNL